MVCTSCNNASSRIRIVKGKEICSTCGDFSEAAGMRLDGVLSRQRVRADSVKHEGDVINPWRYDKNEKKFTPNDDFVKLHGIKAQNFYKPEDLKDYPKLAERINEGFKDTTQVDSVGEYEPRIKEVIAES